MPKLNPIKWSGSKAYCADLILSYKETKTHYIEPFVGSGAVFLEAIRHDMFESYYIGDICKPLIDVWKTIQSDWQGLSITYDRMYSELIRLNPGEKNEYYLNTRKRFNEVGLPEDFFFLLRTCFNGLSRFNRKGEFNSPFHHNRNGADPKKIRKVLEEIGPKMKNVRIENFDYRLAPYSENSFAFFDPPYGGSNNKLYTGEFSVPDFVLFAYGVAGSVTATLGSQDIEMYGFVPTVLSSNSSFRKLKQTESIKTNEILWIK